MERSLTAVTCTSSLDWAEALRVVVRQQTDFLGRASPIKRDMLARLPGPVPLEPMGIHLIGRGLAPGADLSRAHFGPRRVQELDARPRRRCGTRQGLGSRDYFARDLGTPVGEVIGHCKGNRHKHARNIFSTPLNCVTWGGALWEAMKIL